MKSFVIAIFLFVLLLGEKITKLANYRRAMIASMVPASVIGLICFAGYAVSLLQLEYIINGMITGVYVFCLSSMGIAFAREVSGFEPLPVSESLIKRKNSIRKIVMMLLFSVILAALMDVIGSFVLNFCLILFHESKEAQAIDSLPTKNIFLLFPLFLAGAGIAEETMFRLFIQSFIWKLCKKSWASIVLSSFCFALYHLSPMDAMYKTFWEYPLSKFTSVFFVGLVLGYFYKKRGFETVVLGHTLSDYIGTVGI